MAEPEYGLVFASEDLLANEMLSYAWLMWNREFKTSYLAKATKGNVSRFGSFINKKFVGKYWPEEDREIEDFSVFRPSQLYDHPAIVNYMQRKGGKPTGINWKSVNENADNSMGWMIQGAAFALPQILIELVLATLLLFAASRLPSENI